MQYFLSAPTGYLQVLSSHVWGVSRSLSVIGFKFNSTVVWECIACTAWIVSHLSSFVWWLGTWPSLENVCVHWKICVCCCLWPECAVTSVGPAGCWCLLSKALCLHRFMSAWVNYCEKGVELSDQNCGGISFSLKFYQSLFCVIGSSLIMKSINI